MYILSAKFRTIKILLHFDKILFLYLSYPQIFNNDLYLNKAKKQKSLTFILLEIVLINIGPI